MSEMSEIDQVHLRAVMLFYVGDIGDHNKSSIYIGFDGMAEKALSLSFQKLFSD